MDEEEKVNFLKNELFILSINGAFQHNLIYKENVSTEEKSKFRKGLKIFLDKITEEYAKGEISEERHIQNIEKLSVLNEDISKFLVGNKLTFGTSQKLLNLYLKYLWSSGMIKETPPHCPFDSIILGKLKIKDSWTRADKTQYLSWVKNAKDELEIGEKLSDWELKVFSRR